MKNTHIKIGENKVTTNQIKGYTQLTPESGVTGTMSYCIVNGICFVGFSNVSASVNTVLVKGLPKTEIGGTFPIVGQVHVWVTNDGDTAKITCGSAAAMSGIYAYLCYPIATSWQSS